jgi:hypothetical protein
MYCAQLCLLNVPDPEVSFVTLIWDAAVIG